MSSTLGRSKPGHCGVLADNLTSAACILVCPLPRVEDTTVCTDPQRVISDILGMWPIMMSFAYCIINATVKVASRPTEAEIRRKMYDGMLQKYSGDLIGLSGKKTKIRRLDNIPNQISTCAHGFYLGRSHLALYLLLPTFVESRDLVLHKSSFFRDPEFAAFLCFGPGLTPIPSLYRLQQLERNTESHER